MMSTDEIIRQYQSKVALFIAAHYGQYDLAYSMMNLGARPDRPVGEHPSRQWCTSNNSSKLEYLRCPIHESVQSGQLKILTLFSKDSIWVLEEKDGFGIPPWRLALRNSHKDPVKNMNQKDVARFLLGKQFGAKVKISSNVNVSINFYYHLKRWVENARLRVLALHGFSKTSYKKRPFHKGGLVGYKVLVDGFNNNFKDYPNAFEGLRGKYQSSYYFVDEEDKKNHLNPEIYFRTLNTVGAFNLLKANAITKFSKLADGDPLKVSKEQVKEKPKIPDTKERLMWRRAINKIINRNILSRNAVELALIGYVVETNPPSSAKSRTTVKSAKSVKIVKPNQASVGILQRVRNQLAKEEEEDENSKALESVSHLTKDKKRKKEKIIDKLPQIEKKRLKSISVHDMQTSSFDSKPIKNNNSQKLTKHTSSTSMSMTSLTFLPKINLMQSETSSILNDNSTNTLTNTMKNLISEANASSNALLSNSKIMHSPSMSLQNQTMKMYLKYCDGQTPRDIAKKCLTDANKFTSKSWLKQIQIGQSMAQEQAKRRMGVNLIAN
jgi:hypothetical protein